MKNLNKLSILIFVSAWLSGCAKDASCPFFGSRSEDEKITVTAYLAPVIVDLDYKKVDGLRNQVIVQGGFEHAISISNNLPKKIEREGSPIQTFKWEPISGVANTQEHETISFKFDSALIGGDEVEKLNRLILKIDAKKLIGIRVDGHTDSKGPETYNKRLSIKRADAVAEYLEKKGISKSKVLINGYGESLPLDTNSNENGRAKNRRVEIMGNIGN